MADVNANIRIGIDSSSALAQLRTLQSQISQFNNSVVRSNAAAVSAQQGYIRALDAQVSSSGRFITSVRTMESSVDRLGSAFDKGTLSTSQYFRTAMGSTKTFGRFFRREMDQVTQLAERRVKALQTQYVSLGRDAQGAQRIMAMQPTQLAKGYATDLAIANQRQVLFNRALQLGTTSLVNWGKNTQWAGRQLMVGFTVPLTIAAGAAAKFFMDIDKAGVAFRRVYGDFETSSQEVGKNLEAIENLAKEYTKYGLAVSEVIDLGARAAATGATNEDLLAATEQTLRLATLGQMDYNEALDTTISLQTAFQLNSQELAEATDFLNAVENQTVLTIEDLARAIPRVAPVIKGLGGDVKDLAVFMTALREGGVTAEQGANALKSGLASLINPTKRAQEELAKVGININAIVETNKGDLMATVTAFGEALSTLSEFEQQRSLEQVFGKFQYARIGALFNNIARDGSQAATTLELAGTATEDLAALAESELSKVSESVTNQFLGAVERLKAAIAPVGEMFLKAVTPIINAVVMIAEKFNSLPDGIKQAIGLVVAAIGLIAPALLMGIGLIANGIGNGLKAIMVFRNGIRGLIGFLTGSRKSFGYNSIAVLESATAMSQLDARTASLTPKILMQAGAVDTLTRAYGNFAAAASAARAAMPQGFAVPAMAMGGVGASNPIRRNKGGPVPGVGDKDTVPALLTPGETVMNKEASRRFAPFLSAMNSGSLRMLARGTSPGEFAHIGGFEQIRLGNLLRMFDADQFANSFSQAIQARLRNIASVFGEDVAVNMYRSLGFKASGPTNRALAKQGVSPEAFLKDWDTRDTSRWSDSVRRAGLKMSDVDADLGKLDFHMKKYISSLDKGARVTDKTVQDAYNYARTRFSPTSPVFREFDKLQATAREMRVNISKSQAEARGLAVSPYMTKSGRPSSKSFVQAGSSRIKIGGERLMGATMPGIPIAAIQQQAATASSAALKTTGDVIVKEISTASTKAGKQIGPNVMKGASAASPPPWSINLGRWIGQGVNAGMQQQLRLSSSQLRGAVMLGQGGAASPMAMTQAGAFMPLPTAGIVNPQVLGGNYINPVLANQLNNMGNEAQQTAVQTRSLKEKISAVSGRAAGFGAALTGVTIAASFMDNGVGQIAQQAMPVIFGLQGLAMALPMLMNPVGIAIAAFAAVGGGLWFLNNQMNNVRQRGQEFADALTTSADEVRKVGEYFGNESLVQRQQIVDVAERAGVQPKDVAAGLEFIGSDIGQEMAREFTVSLERQGGAVSARQFATKLASMMMQGVIDFDQSQQVAAGLAQQLGQPELSADIIGELKKVVGPDGKDILKNPLQISAQITAREQEIVDSLSAPVEQAVQRAMDTDFYDSAKIIGASPLAGVITQLGLDIPYITDISKNLMSFLDEDFEKATESAQTYGKAVGNSLRNAYDNLNSAIIRNEKAIQKADAADRPELRRKALIQEQELRQQIFELQESAEQNFANLVQQNAALSTEALDAMQVSLKEVYSDPQMQLILDNLFARTGSLDQEVRFNVLINLMGGQLNPMAANALFDLIGNDAESAAAINLMVERRGLDATNEFLLENLRIGDEEVRKRILLQYIQETDPGAEGEGATMAARLEGFGEEDRQSVVRELEGVEQLYEAALAQYEAGTGEFLTLTAKQADELIYQYERSRDEALEALLDFDRRRKEILEDSPFAGPDGGVGPWSPELLQARSETLQEYILVLEKLSSLNVKPKIDLSQTDISEGDLQRTTKILNEFAELPEEMQKTINVDILQATASMEIFDINWKNVGSFEDLQKQITVLDGYSSPMEAFGMSWAQFSNLPNIYKEIVVQYTLAVQRVEGEYKAAAGRGITLSPDVLSGRIESQAALASQPFIPELPDVEGAGRTTSTGAGGGGGGGGGGGAAEPTGADMIRDLIKDLGTQLKLIGDFRKKQGEVVSGWATALRNAGAPEQLIADIISKGEDGIKMARELLKDRAKKLKEVSQLMFEVARFSLIESQRSAAMNAQSQAMAQRGLAGSGISFDVASDIASSPETAEAIAASYKRLQNAERGVQQATEKSRKERKLANQELKAAQKEWNQLTNAIQRNIAQQEKLQIQNLTGEAEQRAEQARRRISAALALTGRGLDAGVVDRMVADPAVANQVSAYVEKLRELERTRRRLAKIKDPTERQRARLKQVEKQIARTEAQYRRLIKSLRDLSKAERDALVAGAEEETRAQIRETRREERAANLLMGQGGLTYDQATNLVGEADFRDALLAATSEQLDALIAQAQELAETLQEAAWTSRAEDLNKEIALLSKRSELVAAAGGNQLTLDYLTSMPYEDILYFLSLSKEEQQAFTNLIEESLTAAEKIADAFDQINERQEYSNSLIEAQANEKFGVMDQYNEEERILDRQIRATGKLVDNAQDQIAAIQEQNDDLQHTVDLRQREIDLLQRRADDYNRGLELIEREEDRINEYYDERLEALDKIDSLNQRIAQRQRDQLSLSQALSEGDIYAATQAAQQARQSEAQFALEESRNALEEARQSALENLATDVNGVLLTREEIEKRILVIEDQIYEKNKELLPLQDSIYQNGLLIYNIQEDILEPLEAKLDLLNDEKNAIADLRKDWQDYYDYLAENAVDPLTGMKFKDLQQLRKLYDQELRPGVTEEQALQNAINRSGEFGIDMSAISSDALRRAFGVTLTIPTKVEQGEETPENAPTPPEPTGGGDGQPTTPTTPTKPNYADARAKTEAETGLSGRALTLATRKYLQSFTNMFTGGMISGAGARDSVPVMASPGEFVVRKSMVDKYGSSMLNKINQGSFMPTFATPKARMVSAKTRTTSNSESKAMTMYNTYSVNVTANTNANADDIANRAVSKIMEIQNRQVRSARVY